ncbi:hypothetical protein H671_6g17022 [Cricetulus griseus]|nr:hypothetical protein H671_6g17022 [Cricetulus griseus]
MTVLSWVTQAFMLQKRVMKAKLVSSAFSSTLDGNLDPTYAGNAYICSRSAFSLLNPIQGLLKGRIGDQKVPNLLSLP